MRDPKRIDRIINKLRAYWQSQPDLRLGQIVHNLTPDPDGFSDEIFYIEDDRIEEALDTYFGIDSAQP